MSENLPDIDKYKSLIELDNIRLEYYKKNPELIIESTPWEAVAVCAMCYSRIALDHSCLRPTALNVGYTSYKERIPKCPNCKYRYPKHLRITTSKDKDTAIFFRIPYLIIRCRSHILEKNIRQNFFGKILEITINKFDEIQIIEDHSNMEVVEKDLVESNPTYHLGLNL